MAVNAPYNPRRGANQPVTAGAASASITLDASAKSVRIVNVDAANVAHIRIGTGAQTATTADMPVRPNSEIIVTKGDGENTLAYISAAGAALHVQTGEGGI
jgi:predicted Fe-Mo cluster-binding NifX family protein